MNLALTSTTDRVPFAPILVRGELEDACALASELGCDGVELHVRDPEDVDPTATRRLLAQHQLTIPTLGTGLAAVEDGLTFADLDPSVRRRAVEHVRRHIALAAQVGSAVTIGSLNGRIGGDKRSARRAAALSCLEKCCKDAYDAGVMVLLEPLNRYECDYLNTIEDVLRVIDQVGRPNLKLLADTFHMNIEEADIGASLRQAGRHLGHVHLADTNRQAPGHGHLDVREVLVALEQIDYGGFLSFEVLPLPSPKEAARDAVRTVRSVSAELQRG